MQQEDPQEFKGILFGGIFESALPDPACEALRTPFQGVLLNRIQCPEVDFSKTWQEKFAELALDVRGAGGSIPMALSRCVYSFHSMCGGFIRIPFFFRLGPFFSSPGCRRYFNLEVMDGPNAYRVPGVEEKQRAIKICGIFHLPEVLHLQLKRFA